MGKRKSHAQKQAKSASRAAKNAIRKNAIKKKKNVRQTRTTSATLITSASSGKEIRGVRHRGSEGKIVTKKVANKHQPTGVELMTAIKELSQKTTTRKGKKSNITAEERKLEKMEERTRAMTARQQEQLLGRKGQHGGEKSTRKVVVDKGIQTSRQDSEKTADLKVATNNDVNVKMTNKS